MEDNNQDSISAPRPKVTTGEVATILGKVYGVKVMDALLGMVKWLRSIGVEVEEKP